MTKEAISPLPQYFQLNSVIIPSFLKIFHVLANMFSKSSVADVLYVGKGYWDLFVGCMQPPFSTWNNSAADDLKIYGQGCDKWL